MLLFIKLINTDTYDAATYTLSITLIKHNFVSNDKLYKHR